MGTKRDIKLNMEQLSDTRQNILDYRARLQRLENACAAFKEVLDNQESVSFGVLSEEMENGIINNIRKMKERMDALQVLLSGYITDMKGYVAPQSGGQMMRVDRNDIWFNLLQLQNAVKRVKHDLKYPADSPTDYKSVYIDWSLDNAQALQDAIDAEYARRQENYRKLAEFRDTATGTGYRPLEDVLDELWKIYNNSIVEFENTDDDYAGQADRYYNEWRTFQDGLQDIRNGLQDFGRGARDAFVNEKDTFLLLGEALLYNDFFQDIFELEVPESASRHMEDFEFVKDKLLADPKWFFGVMGQSMMDTFEEEGLGYAIGGGFLNLFHASYLLGKGAEEKDVNDAWAGETKKVQSNNEAEEAMAAEEISEVAYVPHDLKVDWPQEGESVDISLGRDSDDEHIRRTASAFRHNAWAREYSIEECRTGEYSGQLCDIRLQYAIHTYTDNNKDDDDLLMFNLEGISDEPVYAGAMVEGYADIGDIVCVTLDDGYTFNIMILDVKNINHTVQELEERSTDKERLIQCDYGHGYLWDDTVQLQIVEFITAGNCRVNSAQDAKSGGFLLERSVVATEIINHVDIDDNYVIEEE